MTMSDRASRAYAYCLVTPLESKVVNVPSFDVASLSAYNPFACIDLQTPCVCLAKSSARTDRAGKFWGGRSIENARISPINTPCVCLAKSSARTDRAEKFWG
ncbi:hypothetical protein MIMGU_mgv11b0223041mg, partial [Erythranthe guttata]